MNIDKSSDLKITKKPNKWLVHLDKFRKANPGLSFKDCLERAKETYVK